MHSRLHRSWPQLFRVHMCDSCESVLLVMQCSWTRQQAEPQLILSSSSSQGMIIYLLPSVRHRGDSSGCGPSVLLGSEFVWGLPARSVLSRVSDAQKLGSRHVCCDRPLVLRTPWHPPGCTASGPAVPALLVAVTCPGSDAVVSAPDPSVLFLELSLEKGPSLKRHFYRKITHLYD